jgi:hypothetical protein
LQNNNHECRMSNFIDTTSESRVQFHITLITSIFFARKKSQSLTDAVQRQR